MRSDLVGSRPTRYRVVVLTSLPSKRCELSNEVGAGSGKRPDSTI
ncbi:MAG: hypothetical protein JWM21_3538, partial [Acidobacteria bacterium]|nr:hypothetical protein [Acidobacteriota bacterium]